MSTYMHPTRGTRIHPKGLQSPLEGLRLPHRETGANKGSICTYKMLDSLLNASPLRARERGPFNRLRGRGILRSSAVVSTSRKPAADVVVLSWGWLIRRPGVLPPRQWSWGTLPCAAPRRSSLHDLL